MRNLRLWFSKTGRVKYISHLDLYRTMLRAFRRSGVQIWYTEGFNPQPYISFALALPLGVESEAEVMDVRIEGDMGNEEIILRLNDVLPEGLKVLSAREPWSKVSEICFAKYAFYFKKDNFDAALLEDILGRQEIMAEKMGKLKGRKVLKPINLADHIKSYEIKEKEAFKVLCIVLSAGSTKNANPVLLAEAIEKLGQNKLLVENICRLSLQTKDGRDFE